MKKLYTIAAMAMSILLIGAGCANYQTAPVTQAPADNQAPATPQTEPGLPVVEVKISNFSFQPAEITIKAGQTVRWVNLDSAPHKVASNPHPAHTDLPGLVSPMLNQGDNYQFTFTKAGAFGYHCHLHPVMQGAVIVQ